MLIHKLQIESLKSAFDGPSSAAQRRAWIAAGLDPLQPASTLSTLSIESIFRAAIHPDIKVHA